MTLTKDILIEQLNALFPDNNQAQITPQRLRDYFINVLDSVVVGTLPVVNNQFINVKDYGAVGNGEVDDTQAFLDALATGRNVFVPEGQYSLTGVISLEPSQQLIGSGWNTYLLFNEGTYNDNYCLFLYEGSIIKNLTVTSNIVNSNLRIIEVVTEGITIENVMFQNTNYVFYVKNTLGANTPSVIINNCTFANCVKAILLDRDNRVNVNITNCRFSQNGVALDLNNFNLSVSNCFFEGDLLVSLSRENIEANPVVEFDTCVFKSTTTSHSFISTIDNTNYLLLFKDCEFKGINISAIDNDAIIFFTRCKIDGLNIEDTASHVYVRMYECTLLQSINATGNTYEIEYLKNNVLLINGQFEIN